MMFSRKLASVLLPSALLVLLVACSSGDDVVTTFTPQTPSTDNSGSPVESDPVDQPATDLISEPNTQPDTPTSVVILDDDDITPSNDVAGNTSDVIDSGTQPDALYVVTDNDTVPVVAALTGGEMIAIITDEPGSPEVTSLFWADSNGHSVVMELREDGLPSEMLFDGHVVIFDNYNAGTNTVEVALVTPDQRVHINRDIPFNLAQFQSLSSIERHYRTQDVVARRYQSGIQGFAVPPWTGEDVSSAVIRSGAFALSSGLCGVAILAAATETLSGPAVVAVPATIAFGCAGTIKGVLDLIDKADTDERRRQMGEQLENISFSSGVTGCLTPQVSPELIIANCLDALLTGLLSDRNQLFDLTTSDTVLDAEDDLADGSSTSSGSNNNSGNGSGSGAGSDSGSGSDTGNEQGTDSFSLPTAALCPQTLGRSSDALGIFDFFSFESVNTGTGLSSVCLYLASVSLFDSVASSITISVNDIASRASCGRPGAEVVKTENGLTVASSTQRQLSVIYSDKSDRSREQSIVLSILRDAVSQNVGKRCP